MVLQGEFVVCNQKTEYVGVLKLADLEIYVNYLQIKKSMDLIFMWSRYCIAALRNTRQPMYV